MEARPFDQVSAQRALEALRNGVPNSDAVRALRCMQPKALDAFTKCLDQLGHGPVTEDPLFSKGMLIAGGFGSGKSHTISYLEQKALKRNFVVSRVVISKETPLHDPAKLFLAAVREGRLPGGRGALIHELALKLDYRAPRTVPFVEWAMRRQPHGIIGASVCIHERSPDTELLQRVVDFWSGERIAVKELRQALKNLGIPKAYEIKTVKGADLAPIRFEFVARLARAVGFQGWIILLDEVELIARYSLLQRAKAYAELATWLGAVPGRGARGVSFVAAITDDFALDVLIERKDREKVSTRLTGKGDTKSLAISSLATAGMDLIEREAILLNPPSDDSLQVSYQRLRELYGSAYGKAPADAFEPEREAHRAIRSYVRRWISTWDLERLYPAERREAEEETLRTGYDEDADLASESEEGPAEPA